MDLQDVRRLAVTSMGLAGALLLWLLLLHLQARGAFHWDAAEMALGWTSQAGWMWLGAGLLATLLALVGFTTFGVRVAPRGFTRGSVRQLQCDSCKAVFFVPDSGKRPLTHQCPSCKALGVYDGEAKAVGVPPKARPPREIIELGLTCRTCSHRFTAIDTGVRPMRIQCANCKAVGDVF